MSGINWGLVAHPGGGTYASPCVLRRKRKRRNPTLKEWKEYDRACAQGKVASGGWCRVCERYDCGRGGVNHT